MRHLLRTCTAALLAGALAGACAGNEAGAPFTLRVIGFNDYHGHLESPGTFGANAAVPAAERAPVGGADFLAAHVARLKAQARHSVVVGAGDAIGAAPLISSLFHDEPSVETLNRIGLEFNAVGNHEFDKGWAELLRLQRGGCKAVNAQPDPTSCKGASVGTPVPFEGARFQWLAANVVVAATGKTLLPAYGVKEYEGVKVAFIGMTLKDTPGIVMPTGVAGLDFQDEAATVNALIPKLRAQGIEAIVLLVHEGSAQTGALADINACEGQLAGSPLAGIVRRLDDAVDLVISGHTHAAYNCRLSNASGRAIPVTSAASFGRVLTEVDLTLDPATRDVTEARARNLLVVRNDASVPADATVARIVTAYRNLVTPLASQVIGAIATDLPNTRTDAACNMPAGALVADAMLQSTQTGGFGGAHIALMNGGGVRSPGFVYAASPAGEGDGQVTYGEAFTVQPFGNSLVTLSLTTQDLKDVLEEQFAGCRGQSPATTRVMLPSAGFKYTWDGAKPCGSRISQVTLRTAAGTTTLVDALGVAHNPTATWRVTVNSYMADGGDGYATFLRGTQRIGGAQDIDALVAFMAAYRAPAAPYAPHTDALDSASARIQRKGGARCPSDANVNS